MNHCHDIKILIDHRLAILLYKKEINKNLEEFILNIMVQSQT